MPVVQQQVSDLITRTRTRRPPRASEITEALDNAIKLRQHGLALDLCHAVIREWPESTPLLRAIAPPFESLLERGLEARQFSDVVQTLSACFDADTVPPLHTSSVIRILTACLQQSEKVGMETAIRLCAAGRYGGLNWFGLACGAAYREGGQGLACKLLATVGQLALFDLNVAHAAMKCAAQVGSPEIAAFVLRGIVSGATGKDRSNQPALPDGHGLLMESLKDAGVRDHDLHWRDSKPPVVVSAEALLQGPTAERLQGWVESGMLPGCSPACTGFRKERRRRNGSELDGGSDKGSHAGEWGRESDALTVAVTGFESPFELALLTFMNAGSKSIAGLGAMAEFVVKAKSWMDDYDDGGESSSTRFEGSDVGQITRVSRSIVDQLEYSLQASRVARDTARDTTFRLVKAFASLKDPMYPNRRVVRHLLEAYEADADKLVEVFDSVRGAVHSFDSVNPAVPLLADDLKRCPVDSSTQLAPLLTALNAAKGPEVAWLYAFELRDEGRAFQPEASANRILMGLLLSEISDVAYRLARELDSVSPAGEGQNHADDLERPPLLSAAVYCAEEGDERDAVIQLMESEEGSSNNEQQGMPAGLAAPVQALVAAWSTGSSASDSERTKAKAQALRDCSAYLVNRMTKESFSCRGEFGGVSMVGQLLRSRWLLRDLDSLIAGRLPASSDTDTTLSNDRDLELVADDLRILACASLPEVEFARNRAMVLSRWAQSSRGSVGPYVSKLKSRVRLRWMDVKNGRAEHEQQQLNELIQKCIGLAADAACSHHVRVQMKDVGLVQHLQSHRELCDDAERRMLASHEKLIRFIKRNVLVQSKQEQLLLAFGIATADTELGRACGVAAACEGYSILGLDSSRIQEDMLQGTQSGASWGDRDLSGPESVHFNNVDAWQEAVHSPDYDMRAALRRNALIINLNSLSSRLLGSTSPRQPIAFTRLQCARIGDPRLELDSVGIFQLIRRLIPLTACDELASNAGKADFSPEIMRMLRGDTEIGSAATVTAAVTGDGDGDGSGDTGVSFERREHSLIPPWMQCVSDNTSTGHDILVEAEHSWTKDDYGKALAGILHALLDAGYNHDMLRRMIRLAKDGLQYNTPADCDELLHCTSRFGRDDTLQIEEGEGKDEDSGAKDDAGLGSDRPWREWGLLQRRDYISRFMYDMGLMRRLGMHSISEELEWLFPAARIVQVRGADAHDARGIVRAVMAEVTQADAPEWEGRDLHFMAGNYKNASTTTVVQTLVDLDPPLVPDGVTFRSVMVRWPTLATWKEAWQKTRGRGGAITTNASGWAAGETLDLL